MAVWTVLGDLLCADGARIVLAVLLVAGTLALLLLGKDVPMALWTLDGAAIGFYFGGAVGNRARL
jgi:hypothetical protein